MGKRRKYSAEFKQEAVALANDPGLTKSQIARELGINATLLGRWSRELKERDRQAFGHPATWPRVSLPYLNASV